MRVKRDKVKIGENNVQNNWPEDIRKVKLRRSRVAVRFRSEGKVWKNSSLSQIEGNTR